MIIACSKFFQLIMIATCIQLENYTQIQSQTWNPDVFFLVEVHLVLRPADRRLEGGEGVLAALGGVAAAEGAQVDP